MPAFEPLPHDPRFDERMRRADQFVVVRESCDELKRPRHLGLARGDVPVGPVLVVDLDHGPENTIRAALAVGVAVATMGLAACGASGSVSGPSDLSAAYENADGQSAQGKGVIVSGPRIAPTPPPLGHDVTVSQGVIISGPRIYPTPPLRP